MKTTDLNRPTLFFKDFPLKKRMRRRGRGRGRGKKRRKRGRKEKKEKERKGEEEEEGEEEPLPRQCHLPDDQTSQIEISSSSVTPNSFA